MLRWRKTCRFIVCPLRWWHRLHAFLCMPFFLFEYASQWVLAFKLQLKIFTGNLILPAKWPIIAKMCWYRVASFTYPFSPVHLRNYFLPSPPHNALLLISFLLFSVMFLLCLSVVVLNANEFISDLAFCKVSFWGDQSRHCILNPRLIKEVLNNDSRLATGVEKRRKYRFKIF